MNWEAIDKTVAAWAAVLQQIQLEAAAAIEDGDSGARNDVKAKLLAFVQNSPSLLDGMAALNRKATQTIIDVNNSNIEEALGRIEARTAEIDALTKEIAKTTAEANAAARSIMLQNVTELIGQLTVIVSQAKKVKASLDERGLHPDITTELSSVIETAAGLFPKLRALEDE